MKRRQKLNVSVEPQIALQDELDIAYHLYEHIDTPVSLGLYLRLRAGMYAEVVDHEVKPRDYNDVGEFYVDYQASEFLRKSAVVPYFGEADANLARQEVCLQKWKTSEARCQETNNTIRSRKRPWWAEVARILEWILGPVRVDEGERPLDEIIRLCKHGPGSSIGVGGVGLFGSQKFDKPVTLSAKLLPYARAIMGELWWSSCTGLKAVQGNRFSTVPKNAKTDRPIAIEPTLNQFLQLGIGRFIARRLKRCGFSIGTQESNRRLVRRAWRDGLATIDLSAASDTIASGIVLELFPLEWVELMDICRSEYSLVGSDWIPLEKFSSMGNGYTFPLQSALFLAICLASVPRHEWCDVGVFGDDIIVPQAYAPRVVERLENLGLEPNSKKTHLAGEFFESCGIDTFRGVDVRPFYVRPSSDQKAPLCVRLANAVRRGALRQDGTCDDYWQPFWEYLYKRGSHQWRSCAVPPGWGDTGYEMPLSEAKALTRYDGNTEARRWWETRAFHYIHTPQETTDNNRIRTPGVMWVALFAQQALDLGDETQEENVDWSESTQYSWKVPRVVEEELSGSRFTRGRQARRGLFGRPLPRTGHAIWPAGWEWY